MSASNIFPRQRTIQGEMANAICLIEGGRWLLTASTGGIVLAHDLDAIDIKTKILIKPKDNLDTQRTSRLVYSIDRSKSILTFNLAIVQDFTGWSRLLLFDRFICTDQSLQRCLGTPPNLLRDFASGRSTFVAMVSMQHLSQITSIRLTLTDWE